MKTKLTIKESAKLIRKGVPNNRASDFDVVNYINPRGIVTNVKMAKPIFTLADLFAILPKGIIYNGLSCELRITSWYDEPYFAGYMNQTGKYIMSNPFDAPFSTEELIDTLFQLLCWCLDNNHLKFD